MLPGVFLSGDFGRNGTKPAAGQQAVLRADLNSWTKSYFNVCAFCQQQNHTDNPGLNHYLFI